MSVSDEEPYSTIFASLKHPIRRRILRMLLKNPMSFSEILEVLGVSSSFLTYHLENLGELVGKIDNGKYRLSSFGEAAIATMTKVEDIPTTAPTKTKRTVNRNVAIALGLVSIILAGSLVGAFTYYTPMISDKNNTISSLGTQISQLESNITNLQNQIASDNSTINSLETQNLNLTCQLKQAYANISQLNDAMTNLQKIANLDKSEPVALHLPNIQIPTTECWGDWIPSRYPSATGEPFFKYAGYLLVEVSATADTTVELTYTFQSLNYDSQVDCGTNGTAIFPVLPSSRVMLIVGNSTTPNGATANVTVTYHY